MEYNMSEKMAKALLAARKNEDRKLRPQEYLTKYVTEQFGILYTCVKVNTSL
jgi:hypothetical protein